MSCKFNGTETVSFIPNLNIEDLDTEEDLDFLSNFNENLSYNLSNECYKNLHNITEGDPGPTMIKQTEYKEKQGDSNMKGIGIITSRGIKKV